MDQHSIPDGSDHEYQDIPELDDEFPGGGNIQRSFNQMLPELSCNEYMTVDNEGLADLCFSTKDPEALVVKEIIDNEGYEMVNEALLMEAEASKKRRAQIRRAKNSPTEIDPSSDINRTSFNRCNTSGQGLHQAMDAMPEDAPIVVVGVEELLDQQQRILDLQKEIIEQQGKQLVHRTNKSQEDGVYPESEIYPPGDAILSSAASPRKKVPKSRKKKQSTTSERTSHDTGGQRLDSICSAEPLTPAQQYAMDVERQKILELERQRLEKQEMERLEQKQQSMRSQNESCLGQSAPRVIQSNRVAAVPGNFYSKNRVSDPVKAGADSNFASSISRNSVDMARHRYAEQHQSPSSRDSIQSPKNIQRYMEQPRIHDSNGSISSGPCFRAITPNQTCKRPFPQTDAKSKPTSQQQRLNSGCIKDWSLAVATGGILSKADLNLNFKMPKKGRHSYRETRTNTYITDDMLKPLQCAADYIDQSGAEAIKYVSERSTDADDRGEFETHNIIPNVLQNDSAVKTAVHRTDYSKIKSRILPNRPVKILTRDARVSVQSVQTEDRGSNEYVRLTDDTYDEEIELGKANVKHETPLCEHFHDSTDVEATDWRRVPLCPVHHRMSAPLVSCIDCKEMALMELHSESSFDANKVKARKFKMLGNKHKAPPYSYFYIPFYRPGRVDAANIVQLRSTMYEGSLPIWPNTIRHRHDIRGSLKKNQ